MIPTERSLRPFRTCRYVRCFTALCQTGAPICNVSRYLAGAPFRKGGGCGLQAPNKEYTETHAYASSDDGCAWRSHAPPAPECGFGACHPDARHGLHPDRVAGHCNAWIQWHLSRPRNQTAPERNSAGAGGKRARGRDPRTLAWHSVAQRDGRRKRADTGCHHPE